MTDIGAVGRAFRLAGQAMHNAVREEEAARLHPFDAAPGFFKVRLRHDGAFIPARLWIESEIDPETGDRIADDRFFAELGTDSVSPVSPPMWGAWIRIEQWEWEHMYADLVWCRTNAPDAPIANPTKPAHRAMREFF